MVVRIDGSEITYKSIITKMVCESNAFKLTVI